MRWFKLVVWNEQHYDSFLDIFNVEEDKFHMVIKKFKKKTNAVLNVIIDENGNLIYSDADISIDSEHKKYLGLYSEIMLLNENNIELQDLNNELEINSYYEKGSLILHNFICLFEQLKAEHSIFSMLPQLLDLCCILPDSKRMNKNILKCFLEDESHPHKDCLLLQ